MDDTMLLIRKRFKRFCAGLFFAYFSMLLYMTLFTYNYYVYGKSFNLIFFGSIKLMAESGDPWLFIRNVVGNVALFFPFGFFIPALFRRVRPFHRCALLSLATSLIIEACQYEFAERIFDVDDILLNTLGAIIGWAAFKLFHHVFIWAMNRKTARQKTGGRLPCGHGDME